MIQEALKFCQAGLVLQDFPRKYREHAIKEYAGGVAPEGTLAVTTLSLAHGLC